MRSGARRLPSRLIPGAVLVLLCSSAAIAAEDSAVEWLQKMGEAARAQNYQGILVYRDADVLETLRLIHRSADGQERERLISLSGEPREIVRQNEQVTSLPKQEPLTGNAGHGLFPHLTRETVDNLSEHYELRLIGPARVAGRICKGVAIKPRDTFRYGYQFWGDLKTAVPLKVTLTSPDNARLEEMVFTQVEFPRRIPDSAFTPEGGARSGSAQPVSLAAASDKRKQSTPRWELTQLPSGFQITMRDVRSLPDQRGELEHVLVSDGLSAVSVFVAYQPPPERFFQGFSHMGAVHAYGRMVGEYHIAVVGEVPMETVRMIGDGLRAGGEEELPRLIPPPTP